MQFGHVYMCCLENCVHQLAGHDIIKAINKEMSGELEEGFLSIGMTTSS